MFFAFRPIVRPRRGVSEVMGALLLIVVVIVAVAALASFVSIAEANANNRSAYLTNLKNENLQVVNAQFLANQSLLAPTLPGCVSTPPNYCYRSNPMHWGNVTLTIRNSNTAISNLNEIKISNSTFNYWMPVWYEVTNVGALGQEFVAANGNFLPFPAKATISIFLPLTNGALDTLGFLRNSSLSITLLTQAGNFFTTVFNTPTAVGQVGLATVSYQYFNRDVVSLDGTQSQGANSSQIVGFNWFVDVPVSTCTVTSLNGVRGTDYVQVQVTGKITRFFQESFPSLSSDCLTGPFRVGLSVTDQTGFIGNGTSVIIPADPNMAPIASVTASAGASPSCTAGPNIVVTVTDVFGRPVPGITVLAAATGAVTLSAGSYQTGAGGTVTLTKGGTPGYSCTAAGNAIFTVTVNNLPGATVVFGS
ncbi:MAG TPA: type IV pilin [Nitrososphaerales archaeon]|nr:type IV pilin [Nitrososphaerales archaeon]